MLHGCGWAHVNLKENKVLVTETVEDLGQPGVHCTIIDLGSAIQTGTQSHCQLLFIHAWICGNAQSNFKKLICVECQCSVMKADTRWCALSWSTELISSMPLNKNYFADVTCASLVVSVEVYTYTTSVADALNICILSRRSRFSGLSLWSDCCHIQHVTRASCGKLGRRWH